MNITAIQDSVSTVQEEINSAGYNYQVTLGSNVYFNCAVMEDLFMKLKTDYPAVDSKQWQLSNITAAAFWQTLEESLMFKGNLAEGYGLNTGKQAGILPLIAEFKQVLSAHIPRAAAFYHSELPEGIPGYAVYWECCFVIDRMDGSFLFIYGSASD